MSVVTSITILADLESSSAEQALTELQFVEISKHCGGPKAAQASVWCAAFNYLDDELELFKKLSAVPWQLPHAVMFFINREDEDGWRQWAPRRQYFE